MIKFLKKTPVQSSLLIIILIACVFLLALIFSLQKHFFQSKKFRHVVAAYKLHGNSHN